MAEKFVTANQYRPNCRIVKEGKTILELHCAGQLEAEFNKDGILMEVFLSHAIVRNTILRIEFEESSLKFELPIGSMDLRVRI